MLLDRLLHHAIVVRIEDASYRLRRHADLLPDTSSARQMPASKPTPAGEAGHPSRIPTASSPPCRHQLQWDFFASTSREINVSIDRCLAVATTTGSTSPAGTRCEAPGTGAATASRPPSGRSPAAARTPRRCTGRRSRWSVYAGRSSTTAARDRRCTSRSVARAPR
ncbi:hypothetical protein [Siccirubricoccus deserti]|uniref:hypothetical protein n=1 Tax=Siccirubricoccus deserti TaxID=2013562 RepID=UPI0028F6DA9E|nr:hypothetical protein [Siccirubricoccus deserti]